MTEKDAEALVSKLTLDEKLSLLAGGSQWRTAAIERLGIPNLKVSESTWRNAVNNEAIDSNHVLEVRRPFWGQRRSLW